MLIDEGPLMKVYRTLDSGEREHFDSGMQRDTEDGKTKWHLVASGPMLERWAGLMTRGSVKYDDDNWMKADSEKELRRFRASAYRHFMQWWYGDEDEDHASAIFFNINGVEFVKKRIERANDQQSAEEILDAKIPQNGAKTGETNVG